MPEFWIPPTHILDLRSRVRLRKALMDERSGWQRRIHACLFHEGSPRVPELLSGQGRAALARVVLPEVARERVGVALRMIEAIDRELARSSASLPPSPAVSPAVGRWWATTASAR